MPLLIEPRQERSITVIRLVGSILGSDGANQLRRVMSDFVDEGQHNLLLEMTEVPSLDEQGVATLRDGKQEASARGGDLKLSGLVYGVLAALALHDSAGVFPYYAESTDALESFGEGVQSRPRRFDILEFVKEQEKEMANNGSGSAAELKPAGSEE